MTRTNEKLMTELLDLVSRVEAEAEQEKTTAREAYRGLLRRLARDERVDGDTPDEINRLLKLVGRSAPVFRTDVEEVADLYRLAEEARQVVELRAADEKAADSLRAGQEEYRRVVAEAHAKLEALERARDEVSQRLYASADAKRDLLRRLGVAESYERRTDALAAAEARLALVARGEGEEEVADARSEVERRRAEVWEAWERALALTDHDPFHEGAAEAPGGPVDQQAGRVEGCEWHTR